MHTSVLRSVQYGIHRNDLCLFKDPNCLYVVTPDCWKVACLDKAVNFEVLTTANQANPQFEATLIINNKPQQKEWF